MYVRSIVVSNFKNFKELNLQFNSLNLIVGANASGKSNFIQLIKFIKDLSQYGFDNAISLQGDKDFFRNLANGSNNTKIKIVFDDNKSKSLFSSFTYEISLTYQNRVILKHEYAKLETKDNVIEFFINSSENQIDIKSKNDISDLMLPIEFMKRKIKSGYSLPQLVDDILDVEIFKIKIFDFDIKKAKLPSTINDLIELKENGENLSIVLRNIFRNEKDKIAFLNLVQQALPFVKDINIENYYNENLVLNLQESYYKDKFLPSSVLSDGTIEVFCLVLAMFFDKSNIKIFEEPERALHPYLISRIIALFYDASHDNQIFITTHNPEMLKCVKLEDIYLISRNELGFSDMRSVKSYENLDVFLQNDLGIDEILACSLLT